MKRFTAIIALFTVFFNIASAQLTSSERGEKPYVPTWNTYEFMKYGNIGASLYTGTINYSIPIFEYKDDDFNYTVSIDYATNGFRVNHKSGHLGHGWSLSSPGMITREIHGIADESSKIIRPIVEAETKLYGYNYMPTGELVGDILVHSEQNIPFTAMNGAGTESYDSQPDIYKFNFFGFNGSFRRLPSDIDNPKFIFYDCSSKSQSLEIDKISEDYESIILIDGNGYKYFFCNGEYTKIYPDGVDTPPINCIRQWKLCKITAPNGRSINFYYLSFEDNGGLDKSNHNITYTPTLAYNFAFVPGVVNAYYSPNIDIYENDNFATRLIGIRFADGTRVGIDYIDGFKELRYTYPNGDTAESHDDNKKINSIKVYSNNNSLLKHAFFEYYIFGGNSKNDNHLTFLRSIDISGSGKFLFDYNTLTSYPPLGTIKSDHWGYYNGETGGFDTDNFFSNLIYDDNYNESYSAGFNRNPDYQAALSGTLSKITYPSGGFSSISYEQHDCSKKVIRSSFTEFLPKLIDLQQNEAVGGVRLKQVITYLSDESPSDTVRYEYSDIMDPTLSSGVLINFPRYGVQYTTDNQKAAKRFNLCNSIYDFNQTHIEYTHVREIKSATGYTDYHFSTYIDYEDEYEIEEDKQDRILLKEHYFNGTNYCAASYYNPDRFVTNLLTPFASAQTKRGLMTSVSKYNACGELLSAAKYNYNFPFLQTDAILTMTGEIARDVMYPRYNIELCNTEESMILDNTKVSNKKTSEYNAFGMEKRSESTSSEGLTIIDEYQYSGDCSNDDADIIVGRMLRAHNVNSLLLHQRKALFNGSEVVIGKTRYNYYQPDLNNNSLFKVKSIETWTPSKGWSVKETYVHDECGRVVQLTDSSGVSTSYLWGYKGRYPLMKVKNASFNQLKNMVSTTGLILENLTECSDYDDTAFDKLLASTSHFLRSQPEVYKFMPNIGLSELTLPNSLKSFYSYDGYGRLTSVSDSKQNIIQRGEYNLVSIAPLTANLSCTDSYVDEPVNVIATADGATHTYRYTFSLLGTSDNRKVYEYSCNDGVFNVVPLKTSIASNHYKLECVVEDSISGERVSLCQDIYLKPVVLRFTDINELSDINGNKILTANIFTDTPTTATFILDLTATGNCTVKIGKTSVSTAPCKEKAIRIPLEPGDNQIFISYPSTISIFEVTLQLKEATNDHEVGESNQLSVTV